MSKTSTDPTKYYRTSIAVPLERKVVMDERLAALGLKTIGDLTTLFILAPGAVEALAPVAAAFRAKQEEEKASSPRRKDLVNQIKALTPAELQNLLDTVAAQKSTEHAVSVPSLV